MAKTKGEIISRLRNAINEVTADSNYSNRYLYSAFNTAALQLIKQDEEKGRTYFQSNLWESICFKMEPVDSILCNCMYLPNNCTVYRSNKPIPKILESTGGIIYRFLATPDLSKEFTILTPYQFSVKSKIKYNKEKYAFIHNGYLFTPKETFPLLILSGLFDGDTSDFRCDEQNDNSSGDCGKALRSTIVLTSYLEDTAIKMALNEILPTLSKKPDNLPNASPSQSDISI